MQAYCGFEKEWGTAGQWHAWLSKVACRLSGMWCSEVCRPLRPLQTQEMQRPLGTQGSEHTHPTSRVPTLLPHILCSQKGWSTRNKYPPGVSLRASVSGTLHFLETLPCPSISSFSSSDSGSPETARLGEGSREHVIAAETHHKPIMSERLSKDGDVKRENSPFNNNRSPHLFLKREERVARWH